MEGSIERVYKIHIKNLEEHLEISHSQFDRLSKITEKLNDFYDSVEEKCKSLINKLDEVL
jgi:hypothetical protein